MKTTKQIILCPVCGAVQIARKEGGIYFQCTNCKKIQHNLPEPLKAISIKQPWAWLIANVYKDIENRKWYTNFKGKVLIHAGQKVDFAGFFAHIHNTELEHLANIATQKFDCGGIVGITEITGCVNESDSPWFAGPYGFTLQNSKPLDFIPCKGRLSFFTPEI